MLSDRLQKLSVMGIAREMTLEQDSDVDHFLQRLPSSHADVTHIEEATRGQSGNPAWAELRKGLVTASDIKRVCTRQVSVMKKADTDCSKLVEHMLRQSAVCTTEALEWGRKKEKKARQLYFQVESKSHRHLKVEERGLKISSSKPFIGASADGLVSCDCHQNRLIEIKCPHSLRTKSPKEAARERGCLQDPVTGVWSLKEDSPFYVQIQTQLFVYGLHHCDLVLYTFQGILAVCEVQRCFH